MAAAAPPASGPVFSGIDNFRDFGDAPAAGGRVRKGRLYRSAHHGRATPEDLDALGALGLAVIVDLRRPEERARDPSLRPSDFDGTVVEDDHGEDGVDAYRAFLISADLSAASMQGFLLEYYRKAPFEPRIITLYRRYFAALADAEGPVLIHCAAGKDRTGILAALTHHVLEVDFEHALEDYLLTNDPERIAKRAPLYADHVEEIAGRRPALDAVHASLSVDRRYLAEAFAAMAAAPGGLDGYLEDTLGVTPDMRARIRTKLIAD